MTEREFDAASEQRIRRLLAQQPRPRMPADVEARIGGAIADEARSRAEALGEIQGAAGTAPTPIRRRNSWLAPLVAAAAVVVLAGVVLVPMLRSGGSQQTQAASPGPSCGVTTADSADLTSVMSESGARYSAAGFPAQTASLVAHHEPQCAARAGVVAAATPRGEAPENALAPTPDAMAGREPTGSTAVAITRCLMAVIPGRTVIAVDRGMFRGTRVVVAVVAEPPRALAIDCATQPVKVLYQTDL